MTTRCKVLLGFVVDSDPWQAGASKAQNVRDTYKVEGIKTLNTFQDLAIMGHEKPSEVSPGPQLAFCAHLTEIPLPSEVGTC